MLTVTSVLTEKVAAAFADCGLDPSLGTVTASARPELCHFQCNGCFAAAKLCKKPPFVIAEAAAERLRADEAFSRVEVVKPGFLNLTLSDEYLLSLANALAADEFAGVPQCAEAGVTLIDFGGANVAKPLHVGHLRSAIIGESLKRLARASGMKTVGDVHMGDWGLPLGLVMAELRVRHPDWACFAPGFEGEFSAPELTADALNEIYPFASKKSKEDPAFRDEAKRVTGLLQTYDGGYYALWREIMRISVADMKVAYGMLGAEFELWYGESDAAKYTDELLGVLEAKKLLRASEGATVVDVAEPNDKLEIPPLIIRKSDGAINYDATDLATLIQRQRDFAPARVWYVVDQRQALHFTQVFRCAKIAGLVPPETELQHLGFGTMNGSDGKPYKTRDGGVMRLSDLLSAVISAAGEKIKSSEYVPEADRAETARRVGIAAIKFGDLSNQRAKDYCFDLEKFMAFDGKTGPYLLYTLTRINSIFRRCALPKGACVTRFSEPAERDLALALISCGESYARALAERAPNYICESAYRLASLFSAFYRDCRCANEPDCDLRASRLALCALTRKMLLKHLDILGIEPVEVM